LFIPSHFAVPDHAAVVRLMHDYPFATLITQTAAEPYLSHLPLIHIADCEPHGTLIGHMARANPHWLCVESAPSIALFQGPHAYISPSWYAKPSGAVPTWNYAVVHAYGSVKLCTDAAATRSILDTMVHRFESARDAPWRLGLNQQQLDGMVGAIIGFRFKIKRIDAKFKLSQNRPRHDRWRVVAALDAEPHPDAAGTAAWMRAYVDGAAGEESGSDG
jgi:transcriptional regulator